MGDIKKRADFQVGHIYKPYKDVARKDPAHWHNEYMIPIESHGRSKFTVISFNQARGADIGHTDSWSPFVRKSLFKDITDEIPNLRQKLILWIFEPTRRKG